MDIGDWWSTMIWKTSLFEKKLEMGGRTASTSDPISDFFLTSRFEIQEELNDPQDESI